MPLDIDDDYLPKKRLHRLADIGAQVQFDLDIPIRRYNRTAEQVFRLAVMSQDDGDLEQAYILFHRYCTLVVELFPKHKEFRTTTWSNEEKSSRKKKAVIAFESAEHLKKRLLEVYELEYEKRKASEKPVPKPRNLSNLPTEIPPLSSNQPPPAYDDAVADRLLPDVKSVAYDQAIGGTTAGPDMGTGDGSRMGAASGAAIQSSDRFADPSKTFGRMPSFDRSLKPLPHKDSFGALSTGTDCKPVVVPRDTVDQFMAIAEPNTTINVETCGILCGRLHQNRLVVSHVLVPTQMGTSDSCVTEDEEAIFLFQDAHNLMTLGWIHTHPSQTAFLSSVDLHTQCSYQLMLSEAIAIVVAPKYNETGIFMLTPERGMGEISSCREQGFHPHDSSPSVLFRDCPHASISEHHHCDLIDLRK